MSENNRQSENSINPEKPYSLMDGAAGDIVRVAGEIDRQRKVSQNPENPLDTRLEAYEDIIDSEVGDTSLVRARNIERKMGIRQLLLKFEEIGRAHV